MKKDILFFDVDGTIYSQATPQVSERIAKAIRQVREKGHLCFISTGRPYSHIPENIRSIGFDGMILSHGAHIIHNGKHEYLNTIDPEKLSRLCEVLDKNYIEYALYDSDYSYLTTPKGFLYPFYSELNTHPDKFIFGYDRDEVQSRCVKMEFYAPTDAELDLVRRNSSDLKIYGGYSSRRYDLYDPKMNKGQAVEKILEHYKDQIRTSYAFGDSLNDLEMLSVVDHPILMENASESLKERFSDICPSVEEDGVAVRLTELYDLPE